MKKQIANDFSLRQHRVALRFRASRGHKCHRPVVKIPVLVTNDKANSE